MPSKTEVSERARKCAEDIAKHVSEMHPGGSCELAAIIDRHFAGYEEMIDALRGYASCSDGCTCGDGWGHEWAEDALRRAGMTKQAGSSSPPAAD